MPELFKGRPADEIGRLKKETDLYDFLEKLGIEFERVDHEPLMTMEACEEADAAMGTRMCKNLLLCNTQKTAFYLLMMPGDKKFKTKELSAQIHSARLSFAGPEFMEEFLHISPGSLSVFGLMHDHGNRVRLLIDEDTLGEEYLGAHPLINTSSLKIKMKDLTDIFLPAVKHDFTSVKLKGEE